MSDTLPMDSDQDIKLRRVRIASTGAAVTSGTCTYQVIRNSDDVVIASGSLSHVSGGNWLGVLETSQMTAFVIDEEVTLKVVLVNSTYDRTWNKALTVGISGDE